MRHGDRELLGPYGFWGDPLMGLGCGMRVAGFFQYLAECAHPVALLKKQTDRFLKISERLWRSISET